MDSKRKEKLRYRHIKYILRGKQRWHKQLYIQNICFPLAKSDILNIIKSSFN